MLTCLLRKKVRAAIQALDRRLNREIEVQLEFLAALPRSIPE
jgi:hypothetical protein